MTERKLLEEARDLLALCILIDRSNQCEDMVERIDKFLEK